MSSPLVAQSFDLPMILPWSRAISALSISCYARNKKFVMVSLLQAANGCDQSIAA
jgi:hypothetical protein